MTPHTTAEIRKAYLDFYTSKGHAVIPGASVVPENDPTVLFTTAGMHPLVPYLMGQAHPMGKRLCDVQLCVRTQDIDEVGDASHLTMFEMLGRWSMGDYFKEGAITMSYEFMTGVLGIPKDKFAVTCFEGDKDAPRDDESAKIWESIGVPKDRIGFLPKAKNWWGPAGLTGPCGPDTEMFYWVGTSDQPPAGSNPANDDPNWMEIGNDVLIQYDKQSDGTFAPLTQKNLDEGLGLERLACVLQGVKSVYDTDAFRPMLEAVFSKTSKSEADATRDARIIVDHFKAASFIIADGVRPSNVDQGYVLRRLIRRAIRSARKLEIQNLSGFSVLMAGIVRAQYGNFYTKLETQKVTIEDTLAKEEEAFMKTLAEGTKHFQKISEKSGPQISGIDAFHLYDTYGFPVEMTREMAFESGKTIDETAFTKAFEDHQALSRAGAEKKFAGGLADHSGETTKLHTATHLLNAALRTVLGEHVSQKGSNITTERLRFDFNNPEKMTPEQIKKVEDLVNVAIQADAPISYSVMTVDEAKAAGAIGVFGDKYGDKVKVYTMGGPSPQPGSRVQEQRVFSKEICGGPHVARTGMLGSFKIQKEESSSAGVRRIKAVVSGGPKEIEVASEAM
ncbi:MAG: alanine--tRNA ligase [Candidatus Peribacteraceae bacterium]|nr:alanine--tRNA ligase [Candidatus Peribacteraceae bacterium]